VVDENNNNEDKDVGETSRHIIPSPREYAAQSAAEAPTKEERTDGDSRNSEEDPNPDKAEQRPAQHPRDNQPPAIHISTAASMVSKYKPKDKEQNRNNEGQMETTDATEDDAGKVDTEEIAEEKAAKPGEPDSQTPIEDEGEDGNDKDDDEAARTTKEKFDVPTAEQVNNHVEGAATDSPIEEHDEHTVDVRIAYKTPKGGTVDTANKEANLDYSTNKVTERNNNESEEPAYEPPIDTSEFLDEIKAEADTRTDEVEVDPHHAAIEPGAADDRPAPRDQHPSRDEELQNAAPGPGGDDQPALQDQQPSIII
jgi:hypothetical protein